MTDAVFRKLVLGYYRKHGRHDLPWRKRITPYRVLVSEIMLQQTQVPRVIEKYRSFLKLFPSFRVLARASTADVIKAWQGLGYNRRALALQRCAYAVVAHHHGKLPTDYETLLSLPGIGPYTARAVLAFAHDIPVAMIETNIRRVYLHHYFADQQGVADAKLLPLIERHVRQVGSARIWQSALMDYGTHLATTVTNPNRRSKHYTRQAVFAGSLRQLRGSIVRHVTTLGRVSRVELTRRTGDSRTGLAIMALQREGFLHVVKGVVTLPR